MSLTILQNKENILPFSIPSFAFLFKFEADICGHKTFFLFVLLNQDAAEKSFSKNKLKCQLIEFLYVSTFLFSQCTLQSIGLFEAQITKGWVFQGKASNVVKKKGRCIKDSH